MTTRVFIQRSGSVVGTASYDSLLLYLILLKMTRVDAQWCLADVESRPFFLPSWSTFHSERKIFFSQPNTTVATSHSVFPGELA